MKCRADHYLPYISCGRTKLRALKQFTYLGYTISSNSKVCTTIDDWLIKAHSFLDNVCKRFWNKNRLGKITKISAYRTMVINTIMYYFKSWIIYLYRPRLFWHFHQSYLLINFSIQLRDFATIAKFLMQAEIVCIQSMLLKPQLNCIGHVFRIGEFRLPRKALYGKHCKCHRDSDAPKKRYEDSLKKYLGANHVDHRKRSAIDPSVDLATHDSPGRILLWRLSYCLNQDQATAEIEPKYWNTTSRLDIDS